MSRLPIRWKLTLAFALALTIGAHCCRRLLALPSSAADVDIDIERDLRTRADQLSGLLMREPISALPTAAAEQLEPDETIAQILTPAGGVVAATAYADVRLLTPEQLRDAAVGSCSSTGRATRSLTSRSGSSPCPSMPGAKPSSSSSPTPSTSAPQTLASTLGVEIVGLIAALIASCGVGYWVAGLALRPVEDLAAAGGSDQRR